MVLPTNEQCRNIVEELSGDSELTEWESDFLSSNEGRHEFTPAQKEALCRMAERYVLKSFQP